MVILDMIAPVISGRSSDGIAVHLCHSSHLRLSSSTGLRLHVSKRLSSNVRLTNRSRNLRLQPRAAVVTVPGRETEGGNPAPTDKAGLPNRKRPSAAAERKESEAEAAAVQRAGAVSTYSAENLREMYSKQPFRVSFSFLIPHSPFTPPHASHYVSLSGASEPSDRESTDGKSAHPSHPIPSHPIPPPGPRTPPQHHHLPRLGGSRSGA